MKRVISVFVLMSLLVCSTAVPIYADNTAAGESVVSINTIKGRTNVYNTADDTSIDFNVNATENAYFVDFSVLLADFNGTKTISISDTDVLTVDEQGAISVLNKPVDVTAKENQWLDASICVDPKNGVYNIDLNGTGVSGKSDTLNALTSMTLDIENVSPLGTQVYITEPKTGTLGGGAISAPLARKYITSFLATQGSEPDYIRDTVSDPTDSGKGSVQRIALNNQKWMEGRANAALSGGVWEVGIDLYFDDFNALTNSVAGRMNGTTFVQFCTFNHSKTELVFGNRNGTKVICSGYKMKTWYNLRIVIDFDNSKYAVYLFDNDGTCVGMGSESFESSYTNLTQLSLYVGDSGVAGAKTSTMYVHDYSYVQATGSGVIKTMPHTGATNCGTDGKVYIQSVNAVDPASLSDAQVSVTGTLSMCSVDTIELDMGELEKNTQYEVSISGIKDIFGNGIGADISYTTGNGIIYDNLSIDGGTVKLNYSGDISQEDLTVYAAAYSAENNEMLPLYDFGGVDNPEASVTAGEGMVVQGYLWDSNMNILTPSVGEKTNKYAQEELCDITIVKDYDTNIAVIKGTANNAASIILRDENNNVIMIDEARASANGFFKSEFYTDTIGAMELCINTQDGNGIRKYYPTFYKREQINEIVDSFNGENADIDSLITENAELFGFNLTEYNSVSKATVAEHMRGKEYQTFSDVVNSYNYAMAVALFNAAQDGKTAEELVARYESTYGFDAVETYAYYLELTHEVRQVLFQNIAARSNYTSIEDAVAEFEQQVVLAAIECTEINSEVIPVLKANNAYIGIDFTDFNKVTITSNVTSQIKGKKFDSIEQLKKTFNELVKNELSSNPVQESNSGGGGGGGIFVPKNNSVELEPEITKEVVENIKDLSTSFDDIKEVPWAEECIIYLYNKKIIDGKGDNKFKPNDNITRGEFVKLVSLAFPTETVGTAKVFSDVDENAWYAPYIYNAYANEWINGMSDDIFGVNDNISREDIAVILYRVAQSLRIPLEAERTVLFYDDGDIASYAKMAVNTLAECGIISGIGDNEFMPKRTATRAETAKLLYCLMMQTADNA